MKRRVVSKRKRKKREGQSREGRGSYMEARSIGKKVKIINIIITIIKKITNETTKTKKLLILQ